jgi:Tol biopolymer transport system component
MRAVRLWVCVCVASLLVLYGAAVVPPASAEYFGRNKVQYEKLDFSILKTQHFDIYYYETERDAAVQAGQLAERWYKRLAHVLDHQLSQRQPIILYASHPHFEQTNVISGEIGEGTGGVTESLKRRIILPLAGSLAETDHVIGHELVHAFQYDILGHGQRGILAASRASRLPLWFMEGMAEYLTLGADDPHTAMWMRDAAQSNDLPSVRALDNTSKYFPYRYGEALWAYIAGRWSEETVGEILRAAGRSRDVDTALRSVLSISPESLSTQWKDATKEWYRAIGGATDAPKVEARPLITSEHGGGTLNVAPALSPDGTRLLFFSERGLFSVEIYLADATTGKIIRKVTDTAVDPHFQSLEFINSAGAWSPDGHRFALAAVSKGRPILTILNVDTGRTERELPFPTLGEILNPTWSPDGRRVAFSAMVGGFTDLFVADVTSGQLRRLTEDRYADIEPVWSPDGTQIAFVTDRFTSDLTRLVPGEYRLALISPEASPEASAEIRAVTTFSNGKNINPQWSPDGASLSFVSDHTGIANIYRVHLADGAIAQLTNLTTGVSGITSISPAFAVASHVGTLVFSVHEKRKYSLYILSEATAASAQTSDVAEARAGTLPPTDRKVGDESETMSEKPSASVPDTAFRVVDYHPSLSVDYIAQPSLAIGTTSQGFAVGGGTALYWSDMLGNHNLLTLLEVSTVGGHFLNNLATILAYENRASRWDWAVEVGQVPYITSDYVVQEGTVNGVPVVTQQEYRFWQITREASGTTAYPLSPVQRLEFSAGGQVISFRSEVQTQIVAANTGELLSDVTEPLNDSIPSIALATASAALVFDNAIFGGTSPVLGQRYRVEVSPVVGGLTLFEALTDYRRYVMPIRPLTIAGRVLHYGRYGKGSEDPRLTPLFIGYPSLVRGYNDGSFTTAECVPSVGAPDACPVFDQLIGSRIAVANVEARLPILGALGVLRSPGIPPVELAAFYDAGVAWTEHDQASFLGGSRRPVTSYGGALRVNLFGFAIGEVDLVHPNDRPGKGWYWEFGLQPGF